MNWWKASDGSLYWISNNSCEAYKTERRMVPWRLYMPLYVCSKIGFSLVAIDRVMKYTRDIDIY